MKSMISKAYLFWWSNPVKHGNWTSQCLSWMIFARNLQKIVEFPMVYISVGRETSSFFIVSDRSGRCRLTLPTIQRPSIGWCLGVGPLPAGFYYESMAELPLFWEEFENHGNSVIHQPEDFFMIFIEAFVFFWSIHHVKQLSVSCNYGLSIYLSIYPSIYLSIHLSNLI